MESKIPLERMLAGGVPPRETGIYVACALVQARRTYWNFALQRAGDWSRELQLPLVVVETFPLAAAATFPMASAETLPLASAETLPLAAAETFSLGSAETLPLGSMDSSEHRGFLFGGIASTARRLFLAGVTYHPFVEREPGAAGDLLEEVGARAAILVSDRDLRGVGPAPVEVVDSEYLLPRSAVLNLRSSAIQDRLFLARGEFRRRLTSFPERNPLARLGVDPLPGLPARITSRWPATPIDAWRDDSESSTSWRAEEGFQKGGADRARENWRALLAGRAAENWRALLADRAADDGTGAQDLALRSEQLLWRHLAAGHISPHQVVAETMRHLEWTPAKLAPTDNAPAGSWWGMSPPFERLLDELLLASR